MSFESPEEKNNKDENKLEDLKSKAQELEKAIPKENYENEQERMEKRLRKIEDEIHRLEGSKKTKSAENKKKGKNNKDENKLEDLKSKAQELEKAIPKENDENKQEKTKDKENFMGEKEMRREIEDDYQRIKEIVEQYFEQDDEKQSLLKKAQDLFETSKQAKTRSQLDKIFHRLREIRNTVFVDSSKKESKDQTKSKTNPSDKNSDKNNGNSIEEDKEETDSESKDNRDTNHTISRANINNKGNFFTRTLRRVSDWLNEDVQSWERTKMGFDRLAKKFLMVYPQFWSNRHQDRMTDLKQKLEALNLRIKVLNQTKQDMEATIKKSSEQDIPGIKERMKMRINEVDRQIDQIQFQKDKTQSKIEERENKVKKWTNYRDEIVDNFVNRYETKISPKENELETYQDRQKQIELETEVMKANHDQERKKIKEMEQRQVEMREKLESAGFSLRIIKKTLQPYNDQIEIIRHQLEERESSINQRKKENDKMIAKIDKTLNPYRDRLNEFKHIQYQRPINVKLEKRENLSKFNQKEEIKAHPREKKFEKEIDLGEIRVSDGIKKWNEYLNNNSSEKIPLINEQKILSKFSWSSNFELRTSRFLKILKLYYRTTKKVNDDQLEEQISNFGENI